MEPISTFIIGTVIGGIVSNRADAMFCQVLQAVRERLKQGGKPVNHDLQKAVRKAYLQATLALIDARLRELDIAPSLLQRDLRHLFRLAEEPRQLLKARGEILRELKRLPSAPYIPPSSEAEQQIELLLQPRDEAAQGRIDEFKKRLKDHLQQELRSKWGVEPSERLIDMLQSGWQEGERSESVTLDWFDLLCAFFAEELKQNKRVAHIFQSQLLANLAVEGVSIDYGAFTQQLERFAGQAMARLQQIEQTLEQLRQEQAEGFQVLQQRLDEYLPVLIAHTETIQTVLQTL
ncbi:hypothetical protein HRbin15_00069 [bacterium HR15]|nr:hypothetical protein HRbin15_00069 [bacterium HR15]